MSTFVSLWDRISNEPVLVTTAVGAVLDLLIAFNVPVDQPQKIAILAVVSGVLALFARSQVTPV